MFFTQRVNGNVRHKHHATVSHIHVGPHADRWYWKTSQGTFVPAQFDSSNLISVLDLFLEEKMATITEC